MRRTIGMVLVSSLLAVGAFGCSGDDDKDGTPAKTDAGTGDVGTDQEVDATDDTADAQPEDTATELPPPFGAIQVLTISDFHGQLEPLSIKDSAGVTSYYGGLAYLSAYLNRERANNPNTIILNGGDEIGASPGLSAYGTDLRDEPTVLAFNFLGVDASCIGNHNFDEGTAHLKSLMDIAQYAYVGTNVTDPGAELGSKLVKPYTMMKFGDTNPIKVAIIGISNPETPELVLAGQMGNVTISEPVAATNAAAAEARADGAHVVLVSAHLGATGVAKGGIGAPTGPLVDFVTNLQGVDFVLGGHTGAHVNWQIGDTQIIQSRSGVQTYGKVTIWVTGGGVGLQAVEVEPLGKQVAPAQGGGTCPTDPCPKSFTCSSSNTCEKAIVEPDPEAATLMAPWKDGRAHKFDEPIGTIDTVFVRDGTVERTQEVPMGDLAADAVLAAYEPYGVQIAFMSSGEIRDSLPSAYAPQAAGLVRTGCSVATPCDLVLGDVYTALPLNNKVVVREVPGSMLWDVIEFGLSTVEAVHRRFLQLGGIKIVYKKSAAPGARIQSMTYYGGGTDVDIPSDDTTLYTIAVNDFMNPGGDGFVMLQEEWPTPGLGLISDAVAKYVTATGAITTPSPSDRIVAIE